MFRAMFAILDGIRATASLSGSTILNSLNLPPAGKAGTLLKYFSNHATMRCIDLMLKFVEAVTLVGVVNNVYYVATLLQDVHQLLGLFLGNAWVVISLKHE